MFRLAFCALYAQATSRESAANRIPCKIPTGYQVASCRMASKFRPVGGGGYRKTFHTIRSPRGKDDLRSPPFLPKCCGLLLSQMFVRGHDNFVPPFRESLYPS